MSFFPSPLWIDKGKPFDACTGSLLISLKSWFQLMNNKVIKHGLENLSCCMGDFYRQLNQLGTCFVFLIHSTSSFLCITASMDSPDWFNNFFVRVCNLLLFQQFGHWRSITLLIQSCNWPFNFVKMGQVVNSDKKHSELQALRTRKVLSPGLYSVVMQLIAVNALHGKMMFSPVILYCFKDTC